MMRTVDLSGYCLWFHREAELEEGDIRVSYDLWENRKKTVTISELVTMATPSSSQSVRPFDPRSVSSYRESFRKYQSNQEEHQHPVDHLPSYEEAKKLSNFNTNSKPIFDERRQSYVASTSTRAHVESPLWCFVLLTSFNILFSWLKITLIDTVVSRLVVFQWKSSRWLIFLIRCLESLYIQWGSKLPYIVLLCWHKSMTSTWN